MQYFSAWSNLSWRSAALKAAASKKHYYEILSPICLAGNQDISAGFNAKGDIFQSFQSHCEVKVWQHQVNECSIVGKVKTWLAIVICLQMAFWLGCLPTTEDEAALLFFNLLERPWKLMLMMSGSPFALYRKHWLPELRGRHTIWKAERREKVQIAFLLHKK